MHRWTTQAALIALVPLAAAGCSPSTSDRSTTPSTDHATAPTIANSAVSATSTETTAAATNGTNTAATFDAMTVFGNCSGAIVRFADQTDDDTALMLTNGHCTHEDLADGKHITDLDGQAKALILKGTTPDQAGVVGIDRLEYATMSTTDIAVYRTTATYKELKEKGGITARLIADHPATPGMHVAVSSGYWKTSWDCIIEKVVPIVEESGYRFSNVFTYKRSNCHTKPGSSGAPVIDQATGRVVAINNSGNTEGKKCTEDNPCEIYPDGKILAVKGAGYATQTALLNQCFTRGTVDLGRAECALPGGAAYTAVPATPTL